MNGIFIAIFFGFLMSISLSCKKGSTENSTLLVGNWEIRQFQGGMSPSVTYSAGNGTILRFTSSTYESITNGQFVKSGKYKIETDFSVETEVCLIIPAGQFTKRIVFDGDYNAQKTFIEVSGNNLTFLSGCFALDGGSQKKYEKQLATRSFSI